MNVQPEAAVYCTAAVEAFCTALFEAVLHDLSRETAPVEPKVTRCRLQLALRGHARLATLLHRVDGAALALAFFVDDATSRALHARGLLATREAPHLRPHIDSATIDGDADAVDEAAAAQRHAATRAEWARREDDPFAEADFAAVLRAAHPALTLSFGAAALLSALVRELLNAACDALPSAAFEAQTLSLSAVVAALAAVLGDAVSGAKLRAAVDIFSTGSSSSLTRATSSAAVTLRVRLYLPGPNWLASPTAIMADVSADAAVAVVVDRVWPRTDAAVGVFRGREVAAAATPAELGMGADDTVFVVPAAWWTAARRGEARRGRLASQRPTAGAPRGGLSASASAPRLAGDGAGVDSLAVLVAAADRKTAADAAAVRAARIQRRRAEAAPAAARHEALDRARSLAAAADALEAEAAAARSLAARLVAQSQPPP